MNLFRAEIAEVMTIMDEVDRLCGGLKHVAIGDFHLYDSNGEEIGIVKMADNGVTFEPWKPA